MFVDFDPVHMNGFTTYALQSEHTATEIINNFELAMSLGLGSDEALKYACYVSDASLDDLTDWDRKRVMLKVQEFYKSSNNTRR